MKSLLLLVTTSCLLLACASNPIKTEGLLTLQFYPDCDFEILDIVTGTDGYTSYEYVEERLSKASQFVSRKHQGDKQKALYQLKKKAIEKGAGAIAITSFKNMMGSEVGSKGGRFNLNKYIYQAQAIKLCSTPPEVPYNTANSKPVRYDEAGNVNLGNLTSNFKLKPILTELTDREEDIKPTLSNHTIKSSGDIFGLSLGMSIDQLQAKLGKPSATIMESKNKKIFQYGRRHLFYLDNDIFVAYEYSNWFLPPHLNNKVLFHDQFEKLKWTLDKEINLGDSLEEIKEFYGKSFIKQSSGNFKIENKNIDVKFTFHLDKNHYTEKVFYKLGGLVVSKKDVSFKSWDEIIASNTFKRSVDIGSAVLPIMPDDSKQQVKEKLGEPKALMKNSRGKLTWLYDNELSISFYGDKIFNYSFEKSPSKQKMNQCKYCLYLGQDEKSLPIEYLKKSTDFEYLLENNGIVYSLNFSDSDGINHVKKIKISTKL